MKNATEWLTSFGLPFIGIAGTTSVIDPWVWDQFRLHSSEAVAVRRLRGRKMRTTQSLMDEFSAALQFFDGFGENWYALKECLSYMDEWLPANSYLLIINDAELVLSNAPAQELKWFFQTLKEVSNWWSTPVVDNGRFTRDAIPFHVLLQTSESKSDSVYSKLQLLLDDLEIEVWISEG